MKHFVWMVPLVAIAIRIRISVYRGTMNEVTSVTETMMANVVLTGNAKRKQSCQRVGGEKKRVGHKREDDFKRQFNPQSLNEKTEYAATSDTWLERSSEIAGNLRVKFGLEDRDLYVSNKSGNNIQLTLGVIPELALETNKDWIENPENCTTLFNKYLKKGSSERPADLLVYKDVKENKWVFFKMDDVVEFIATNAKWRRLDSGRLKGDFEDSSRKGLTQYITYEYRSTHKSHFLGMNGNKGIVFISLLKEKISFHEVNIVV